MTTYTIPIQTADGIDHGMARYEECLDANIYRFEDGYVLCPILWSGGRCEERKTRTLTRHRVKTVNQKILT